MITMTLQQVADAVRGKLHADDVVGPHAAGEQRLGDGVDGSVDLGPGEAERGTAGEVGLVRRVEQRELVGRLGRVPTQVVVPDPAAPPAVVEERLGLLAREGLHGATVDAKTTL